VIETNNRLSEYDPSSRLNRGVDKLINSFRSAWNMPTQPADDGGVAPHSPILCHGDHGSFNRWVTIKE
jgi:hypothetical protein